MNKPFVKRTVSMIVIWQTSNVFPYATRRQSYALADFDMALAVYHSFKGDVLQGTAQACGFYRVRQTIEVPR